MIKYEQIKEANDSIRTTDIKGKEYAEVNQRIKAFRMVHPNGAITTEIVNINNGVVIIKATIMDEDNRVIGTGYAQEKEGSTFINKTSFIENCETSAVGRALGMCGFGIDTSVASAEEVQNAIANQDVKQDTKPVYKPNDILKFPQSKEQLEKLSTMNIPKEWLLKVYGFDNISFLDGNNSQDLINAYNKKHNN